MDKALLLDNGLLLASLVDFRDRDHAKLKRLCAPYARVLYEASGRSAIERTLQKISFLAGKLVPIHPHNFSNPPTPESKLLETTVHECLRRGPLVHALHAYQIAKGGGNTAPEETLRYVIHLLLLARQFRADLAHWQPRQELFLTLFSEAGLDITTETQEGGHRKITTSVCVFPYLPRRKGNGDTRFTLVAVEDDTVDEQATVLVGSEEPSRGQVFISYSHRDARWLQLLNIHLKPLIRNGSLAAWSDKDIEAGKAWLDQIWAAMASARAAILIVTPNFLASDFIMNEELPFLLERARRDGMKIFWIAVSASLYQETELAKLQSVNNPARPLDCLAPPVRQRELVDICKQIIDRMAR